MNQEIMDKTAFRKNRSERFVESLIVRMQDDKAFAAKLRRADNSATEYQSWEILASFNINLEKPWERLPYALIAAALAKAKIEKNGESGLGQALAHCYDDDSQKGSDSDAAKIKLRRLLSCESIEELCQILRPTLSLILSKQKSSRDLNFASLLEDLLNFYGETQRQRIKAKWAQNFYQTQNCNLQKKEVVE